MLASITTPTFDNEKCVHELLAHTDRAARLFNRCQRGIWVSKGREKIASYPGQWAPVEMAKHGLHDAQGNVNVRKRSDCLRRILERQLAVRAEDSDDDDDAERTYAFPPPVDLDAYAAACRLPPAEETEDEREARFQRERCFGL